MVRASELGARLLRRVQERSPLLAAAIGAGAVPARPAGDEAAGSRRYRVAPDALSEAAGEEVLLVHLARGSTFRLSSTACVIWARITEGRAANEIAHELAPVYGVTPERLQADVLAFLAELLENALIEPLETR